MPDGDGEKVTTNVPVTKRTHVSTTPFPNVGTNKNMKVSVVIPTYNRSEMLYRTLYTLYRQKDPNYEVLVSNDDDNDRYKETEKVCNVFIEMGMPLRYFYTAPYKRGGEGWSVETYPYNVGIRHAEGHVIMLNSGDVMSVTNTIDQHRRCHQTEDKVYISTVHAILLNVQNNIEKYNWKENTASLLFKGSCYKMFTGIGKSYTEAYDFEDAGTPYHFQMSIRKEHLHAIRGFDEDYYGVMGCGDDDLANRLKKYGLQFSFKENIISIHQHHFVGTLLTKKTSSIQNPKIGSGHDLYKTRSGLGIVRNANHEWGQYPRDMKNLPDMSGIV